MHITKIKISNFKRFSDLTIDLSNVQSPPKLVLLIGANGSGKSSLFDAFEWISKPIKEGIKNESTHYEDTYYIRFSERNSGLAGKLPVLAKIDFDNNESLRRLLNFVGSEGNMEDFSGSQKKDLFYGRSALRQTPRITKSSMVSLDVLEDIDRPRFYIDADNRFENDVSLWLENVLRNVFGGNFNAQDLKERLVLPMNNSLRNIFGEDDSTALKLVNVLPPSNGKPAQINFEKGNSTFSYDLLSSGEKEIFGILLNLLVRRENYQDTIYFIDELDVHLNTSLQYALLKEITENWIPENCQLWTATHSLGFIQYARESENAAILDFDQFDFDLPQIIVPQPKENLEVFEVAVPKEVVFQIFDGKQIILCENKDDDFYNLLSLEDKVFVGVQNKDEVFRNIKSNPNYFGIIDRDYLTDNEINTLQARYPNLFILDFYNFENYLYHPENIKEISADFDANAYGENLAKQKSLQFETTLLNLKQTRNGYKILRDENLAGEVDSIVQALKSDDFNDFYTFFNMKNVNHSFLDVNKLTKKQLAKTIWFKEKIVEILNRPRQSSPQK